jgi:hypothetical protein
VLLLGLALLLGHDNWRTGIGWDSTGPQAGYFRFICPSFSASPAFTVSSPGDLRHPRAASSRDGGVRADLAVLSRHAVSRNVCREFPVDRGLHAAGGKDRVVEIATRTRPSLRHVRKESLSER